MARLRRLRSISATLARVLVGIVAFLLILVGLGIAAVETGWAKNRLRDLIVRQANNYLTATLTIGRLGGSLFRGLELGDITLSRDGRTLIHVDEVALSYSIRELVDRGTVIRSVRLTRPQVTGAKLADGRWDLGALVKRESHEEERSGPGRPIAIQSIEVVDGDVHLAAPLDFGPTHIPTHFEHLNASFAFTYVPVRWAIDFHRVSWVGSNPELSVNPLSGRFGRGPGGWFFQNFAVQTARSAFTLDGRIRPIREGVPTELDLTVHAPRFAFQEWAGVLRGLKNIAVETSLDTSIKGPTNRLETDLKLAGTGGRIAGHITLDSSVPGWHGRGAVDVATLNLARWMNREDRPSEITGRVTFDMALELGRRFPHGAYTFDGAHAMYMNYGGDDVHARGQITTTAVEIADARAIAYGARVTTHNGTISLDEPFRYRFSGTTTAIDLRQLPAALPVPHVDSALTFDYDVEGSFVTPFVTGRATFADSVFLGARVHAGTVGTIDTVETPFRYTGDGEVTGIELRRFGEGLDIAWLRDPRYAGTIAGHFRVDGTGSGSEGVALTGGGHLDRAEMFSGMLSDANVSVAIDRRSLRASYDGRIEHIDPSIPFASPSFAAVLNGRGRVTATVNDLMARETTLADYDIAGTLDLGPSTVRGLAIDRGRVDATLRESALRLDQLELAGAAVEGRGHGVIGLTDGATSEFDYDIARLDLAQLKTFTGRDAEATIATTGRVTGPSTALHIVGDATVNRLNAFNVSAISATGSYDATLPASDPSSAAVSLKLRSEFVTVAGQALTSITGTVSYAARHLAFDLAVTEPRGVDGRLAGGVDVNVDRREAALRELTLTIGRAPWRLMPAAAPPAVSWSDEGVTIAPVTFAGPNGDQRIGVSGTWRADGAGALRVTASHVSLDTVQTAIGRRTRYGGTLDADATIRGPRTALEVDGTLTITAGRVERVFYQKLAATFATTRRRVQVDVRLDQSRDIWFIANGTLPMSLFNRNLPDDAIDITVKSSTIDLGLVEGLTAVVRNVSGQAQIDVKAIGTGRDPHFIGTINVSRAGFLVTSSGSRYKNIRADIGLAPDKIAVEALHVEDSDGHPLDLHGSLGTPELRVGDVEVEARARGFEVMRNELGRVNVDIAVQLRGRFEAPRVAGDVTIRSATVKVDEILARTLFQPYATEETSIADVDPLAALNPWERMGLDVSLRVPGTLHLTGDNVQVSPGTPIGMGDFNLHTTGDLYLYKDPGQPLFVTGSFDSITGTYAFQGRRFDVLPASSINFRGDLNPDVYVTVSRVIQGVETRVSIFGPMRQPELRLASTPPLDESDVLSLIIFNTSTNQLTGPQQQQLLVRAGTLAAGFLAGQVLSAVQNGTGLEVLELETSGDYGGGAKITIGDEIAPGLVARFSRQFGQYPYDEASIEYALFRIFRIRATYSDAQTLSIRSPFRRVERAGIDFLVFFSF